MTIKFKIQLFYKSPIPNLIYSDNYSDYQIHLSDGNILYCHKLTLSFYSKKFFKKSFMDKIILNVEPIIIEKFIILLYDNVYESKLGIKLEFKDNEFCFDLKLIDQLIKISKLAELFNMQFICKSIENYCDKITKIERMNTNYKIDGIRQDQDVNFNFDYYTGYSEKRCYYEDFDLKCIISSNNFGYIYKY